MIRALPVALVAPCLILSACEPKKSSSAETVGPASTELKPSPIPTTVEATGTVKVLPRILLGQSEDGGYIASDVPPELVGAADGAELTSAQNEIATSYATGPEKRGLRVKWRVVVDPPRVTVGGGGSVTVKPGGVTVGSVTVTPWPRVTIGSPVPKMEPQPGIVPYNLYQECRPDEGGAKIFVVNKEKKDLAVTMNVAGAILPKMVVKKLGERLIASFKMPCPQANDYVGIMSVDTGG